MGIQSKLPRVMGEQVKVGIGTHALPSGHASCVVEVVYPAFIFGFRHVKHLIAT